jgi:lipid-binding SYLF domain-containing protein
LATERTAGVAKIGSAVKNEFLIAGTVKAGVLEVEKALACWSARDMVLVLHSYII